MRGRPCDSERREAIAEGRHVVEVMVTYNDGRRISYWPREPRSPDDDAPFWRVREDSILFWYSTPEMDYSYTLTVPMSQVRCYEIFVHNKRATILRSPSI